VLQPLRIKEPPRVIMIIERYKERARTEIRIMANHAVLATNYTTL